MTDTSPGGRVVLVVGASSGIGLASALAFARCGDHLILNSRSADALEAADMACRAVGAGDIDLVEGATPMPPRPSGSWRGPWTGTATSTSSCTRPP